MHERLEDKVHDCEKNGTALPLSSRLNDIAYHTYDSLGLASKVEVVCLVSTIGGETLSRYWIGQVADPRTFWMNTAVVAAGMATGCAMALATYVGGVECCHDVKEQSLYSVLSRQINGAYKGVGTLLRAVRSMGTSEYRAERWQHIVSGVKHVVFGELVGCIGVGALTEQLAGSFLGANTYSQDDPHYWMIWAASTVPAMLAATGAVALSIGYDAHKQCLGKPHEH